MNHTQIPFLILILLVARLASAQHSGPVEFKHLGVRFTIPPNWIGQESEEGMVLGSNTEAGLIVMIPHEYRTIQQIQQEGDQGVYEEGIMLSRSGPYQSEGSNGTGAVFSGTIQGEQAKAYLIGLINPTGGSGITVMALTSEQAYSSQFEGRAKSLAQSIAFFKAEKTNEAVEWKQYFSNKRLTYMNTYTSTDYGGGYSGYSDKQVFHLCSQGYFKSSSSSHSSFDSSGGFGYVNGQGQGAGTWDVVNDAGGNSVLQLNYHDGSVSEYTLSYDDGKTTLNGTRYFVTGGGDGADYAADCP